MSYEELDRASVIERVIERRLTQREAARMLGLTSRQVRRLERTYGRLLLLAGAVWLLRPAGAGWRCAPRADRGLRLALACIGPALVLASGLSPYLGLKTLNAFSMYSNLRTEGGVTNHLLVPTATQVFPFQRDLVVIESANVRAIKILRGQLVPFFQLRILTSVERTRPLRVRFTRPGTQGLASDERDLAAYPRVPWLGRKLLQFRPIELEGPRRCGL